ncbi:hypothetical protein Y032_0345g3106 [Ancylostoma ceylanicum]|uniref:Uncharacterized protein n=1 Tax=Ancylostoma ceylanicum TaxID=53326 RepID=A0A016RY39_9BILA|nr:hypothetical protein Y032_0345g3106 [Ancylostoma ceylanicum]
MDTWFNTLQRNALSLTATSNSATSSERWFIAEPEPGRRGCLSGLHERADSNAGQTVGQTASSTPESSLFGRAVAEQVFLRRRIWPYWNVR